MARPTAATALLCALAVCCASTSGVQALSAAASASSSANDSAVSVPSGANATSTAATATVGGSLVGWFDCSPVTFADELEYLTRGSSAPVLPAAQCAQLQAPLCYTGICEDATKRTIDVFFKRIPAKSDAATKPSVWFLQGGPGAGSSNMEQAMVSLYKELKGDVNVYTMDHRGTGRSTLLDCVAAQATTSGSPNAGDLSPSEVAECAKELEIKYGKDLSAFSITSAATDIASFIAKYQSGSKVYVYGVSYGTALVERLMHLSTPEIVGYILDGVATTSGAAVSEGMYMSNWDVNFGEVGDHFLDLCMKDTKCGGRFASGLSIQDIVKEATTSFSSLRCAFPSSSSSSSTSVTTVAQRVFGHLLMRTSTRGAIPALAYRMARCNSDDGAAVYNLAQNFVPTLVRATEDDAYTSTLLYYLIVFSEMWEDPTPSIATLSSRYKSASMSTGPIASMVNLYCAFTKSNATTCAPYAYAAKYAAGPIAYKKDKYWNVAAPIPPQASVLILSGKLDPQTPHKYAERLYKAIDGSKKELVAFEYASHGALFTSALPNAAIGDTTCGMTILASYVTGAGDLSKLDKSCLSKLTMTFEPTKEQAMRMFNTSDAYDGKAQFYFQSESGAIDTSIGETEEKYSSAFIGVAITAAVLLIVAGAMHGRKVMKHRAAAAAAQAAKSPTSDAPQATEVDVTPSPSAASSQYVAAAEARV